MLTYLRIVLAGRLRTERGASAVEYALIVAGVAALCFVVLPALGFTLGSLFNETSSKNGISNSAN